MSSGETPGFPFSHPYELPPHFLRQVHVTALCKVLEQRPYDPTEEPGSWFRLCMRDADVTPEQVAEWTGTSRVDLERALRGNAGESARRLWERVEAVTGCSLPFVLLPEGATASAKPNARGGGRQRAVV